MYDKDLIMRVCDLSCSKEDVVRNQTTVKYDTHHPFRTYYDVAIIRGALEKFLANEWDDQTLAHWACIYCWILSGGFEEEVTESLNSFERFLKDVITWDLDGLSFFDGCFEEDPTTCIGDTIALFENYDRIWQNREQWRAVYALIGPYDEHNGAQWVLLINERQKEYMILYSDFLKNGYRDKFFKPTKAKEFISLAEKLKAEGYTLLSCAEDYYYEELEDLET